MGGPNKRLKSRRTASRSTWWLSARFRPCHQQHDLAAPPTRFFSSGTADDTPHVQALLRTPSDEILRDWCSWRTGQEIQFRSKRREQVAQNKSDRVHFRCFESASVPFHRQRGGHSSRASQVATHCVTLNMYSTTAFTFLQTCGCGRLWFHVGEAGCLAQARRCGETFRCRGSSRHLNNTLSFLCFHFVPRSRHVGGGRIPSFWFLHHLFISARRVWLGFSDTIEWWSLDGRITHRKRLAHLCEYGVAKYMIDQLQPIAVFSRPTNSPMEPALIMTRETRGIYVLTRPLETRACARERHCEGRE